MRVAYSPDLGYARVDPEIAAAVAAAVKQFEALGALVEEVGEVFPSPREALITLWGAGAARVIAGFPRERRGECDPGFRAVAEAGEAIQRATDYVAADLARTALGRTMAEFHQRYDRLLTPMMPVPALPVGQDLNDPAHEEHWIDWSPFSYPFNMTRQPAATVPCGLTSAAGSRSGCRRSSRPAFTPKPARPPRRPRLRGDAAGAPAPDPGQATRPTSRARCPQSEIDRPEIDRPEIVLTDTAEPEELAVIADGLRAYNTEKAGYNDYKRLAIFVKDPETGKIVGGIYGGSYLGQLSIERVYLPEGLRRYRLGSRLIAMAEAEARRRCYARITLNFAPRSRPRAST